MNTSKQFKEWIQKHKVCWEMLPYCSLTSEGKKQIGFELDLYAQFEDGVMANPGCSLCDQIFAKLRDIARLVLPKEHRPTRYDIQVFDAAFHYRPETNLKPEVQLTVLIVHRQNYLGPVDACESKCAREIQEGLRAAGVPRKVWSGKNKHFLRIAAL